MGCGETPGCYPFRVKRVNGKYSSRADANNRSAGEAPVGLEASGLAFLPDQAVAAEGEAGLAEAALPAGAGAEGRRVVEQAVALLLRGQAGEAGLQRVIGVQESLLAVQHGRVGAGGVVVALQPAAAQRQLDAAEEGRVRVGVEGGVGQVRDLAGEAVQLDDVGPVDPAEVGPAAAFVDAQERLQGVEGARVDVEGVRLLACSFCARGANS